MTFANPLPAWLLVAIVIAAVLVAWLVYRRLAIGPARRSALIVLRVVTLLVLVLMLMRPVVRSAADDQRDAVVAILVDTSRSMGLEDAGGRARVDRAREIITGELLPAIGSHFHVETLAFGEALSVAAPAELSATARRSNLAEALAAVRERYRGKTMAGIVLISDGGDTGGTSEGEVQRRGSPPIFAIGVGSATVDHDREVLSVTAAEAVLDDSRVDLAASVVSHGHGTDPIELRLLENGRPIEVRRAQPAADGTPVREVFQVSPGRGAPTVYTVQIPEASDELAPENNTRSALVLPPSRPRRILLVEGAPGFEHSFLKRAWMGDGDLEIDSAVRKGENESGSDTFYIQAASARSAGLASGYPQNREALFAYDAIVLANVNAAQFTSAQLEATRDFVAERGGGLLVLGARSFQTQGLAQTAIDEVLPLDLRDRNDIRNDSVVPAGTPTGRNRVTLTEAGQQHPLMQLGRTADETRTRWDAAPPLASIVPLGGPRPGAAILAMTGGPGGAPRALVAVQRYGEGRSMIFTGEASWRWRMMLPSTDRSFDTFWRQAVRWLALPAGDPLGVTVPVGGSPGDTLSIAVIARNAAFVPQSDAAIDLRVTAPDGRTQTLRAAPAPDGPAFVARFRPDQPGVYRVNADARRGTTHLGSASTSMLIGGADLEMTDPRLNTQVLQRLALASGGRVIGDRDGAALLQALESGLPAAAAASRRDLWHTGWSFAAIVLLLAAEWVLRRRWGLR